MTEPATPAPPAPAPKVAWWRKLLAPFRRATPVARVLYQNRKVELAMATSVVALIRSFLGH